MNKSDYQIEKKGLDEQLSQLRENVKSLNSEYIEDNSEFKAGQKVELTIPESKSWNDKIFPEYKEIVFIGGYEISYGDNVTPWFWKCKRDGNQSKHKVWIRKYTSIKTI